MSQQSNCAIAVIGIDIGKNSFHVVGHDRRGAIVLRQKWSRGQVEARLANLPPCLIGMEACVGAHHLSRKLQLLGHDARLMPAKYVRPYNRVMLTSPLLALSSDGHNAKERGDRRRKSIHFCCSSPSLLCIIFQQTSAVIRPAEELLKLCHRCKRSMSRHTASAMPPPSTSSRQASTSRSSAVGLATRASTPPTTTRRRIWKQSERHWNWSTFRRRQVISHHGSGIRACSPGSIRSKIMRRNFGWKLRQSGRSARVPSHYGHLTISEAAKERRGRCRGDLRSGPATEHAVCGR